MDALPGFCPRHHCRHRQLGRADTSAQRRETCTSTVSVMFEMVVLALFALGLAAAVVTEVRGRRRDKRNPRPRVDADSSVERARGEAQAWNMRHDTGW